MNTEEFKNVRLRLGHTQKTLAEALGMKSTAISRIERGQVKISIPIEIALKYLQMIAMDE